MKEKIRFDVFTLLIGIFVFMFISIFLMIPILNVFIVKSIRDAKEGDFWNGMWYCIERS